MLNVGCTGQGEVRREPALKFRVKHVEGKEGICQWLWGPSYTETTNATGLTRDDFEKRAVAKAGKTTKKNWYEDGA